MWSEWVWVMSRALTSSKPSPRAARQVVMRRQEMPASTSRWVEPWETSSALPEEPLARVCMVVKKLPRF